MLTTSKIITGQLSCVKIMAYFVSLLSLTFTLAANADREDDTADQKILISKVQPTLDYLGYVLKNNVKDKNFVTQKELQETLRFAYRDELTYFDFRYIQEQLENDVHLTIDQKAEATRLMSDIMYVESRMNEYRIYSKFYCRFALKDNPMDEVAQDSILKRPDLYRDQISDEDYQSLRVFSDHRAVVGLCWQHKPQNVIKYERQADGNE